MVWSGSWCSHSLQSASLLLGFEKDLDHLSPEREQTVEPFRIVVPKRAQRHASDDAEGERHNIGCKRGRNTTGYQRLGPGCFNRPACLPRNVEDLLAHRLIGGGREHDVDRHHEMFAEEELLGILDHCLDQVTWSVYGRRPTTAEDLRLLKYIFERCDNKRVLGREMVELSATGKASLGRDLGGTKSCIAAASDQIGRCLQDSQSGFRRPLGLGTTARRRQWPSRGFQRSGSGVGAGGHVRPQFESSRRRP